MVSGQLQRCVRIPLVCESVFRVQVSMLVVDHREALLFQYGDSLYKKYSC
jgi:hypothetical protein